MIDNVLSDLERFQTTEAPFAAALAHQTARVDAKEFSHARGVFLELFSSRSTES